MNRCLSLRLGSVFLHDAKTTVCLLPRFRVVVLSLRAGDLVGLWGSKEPQELYHTRTKVEQRHSTCSSFEGHRGSTLRGTTLQLSGFDAQTPPRKAGFQLELEPTVSG